MGSSNMDYRGSGFWVHDYQAEVWLYLLAQEAKAVADAPAWLAHARDDWEAQATAGFMGCVSSCLDERLGTDPDRVALALRLSERAVQRLLAWAPAIPKDLANSFGTGGNHEAFDVDLPTNPLLACGRAFISLLRGEVPPGYDRWAC
ncbi:hypothetical protein HUT16_01325 [Kitasatospora sp. NA04385]|uniref:hypothetical protein n=1 Tax=Kitasatospora sp. NA04385 TaxID=2742135 RepID=UPI001590864E|nr:hypothetical protein [Kitasatospora sp. NA04385]QKW17882.1 hypothetical protein HUT16_01325 [Kitasatospora sp. NA04385]